MHLFSRPPTHARWASHLALVMDVGQHRGFWLSGVSLAPCTQQCLTHICRRKRKPARPARGRGGLLATALQGNPQGAPRSISTWGGGQNGACSPEMLKGGEGLEGPCSPSAPRRGFTVCLLIYKLGGCVAGLSASARGWHIGVASCLNAPVPSSPRAAGWAPRRSHLLYMFQKSCRLAWFTTFPICCR